MGDVGTTARALMHEREKGNGMKYKMSNKVDNEIMDEPNKNLDEDNSRRANVECW